jgi:hypothetical protein
VLLCLMSGISLSDSLCMASYDACMEKSLGVYGEDLLLYGARLHIVHIATVDDVRRFSRRISAAWPLERRGDVRPD